MIKRYLPRSLFGRSLLIVVIPLVILQVVSAFVFYESHWETVSRRLARDLAGDIAILVNAMRDLPDPPDRAWMLGQAARHMGIVAEIKEGAILPNADRGAFASEAQLRRELDIQLSKPYRIDAETMRDHIVVDVQLADGVLSLIANRKRLFSTTTHVFVLWMVGTSLILFGVATVFLRNQVKPVLRLARAADDFGKGRDVPTFKPEGAREVRQAAHAFLAMRQRILRQIGQRTAMLAGVSHDLRTPLTRMKLQLEMMPGADGVAALKEDVLEMERMLESYLAFARGEGAEKTVDGDLGDLLDEVVRNARRNGGAVELSTDGELRLPLRPTALQRCFTNLVDNALRYARHVRVHAQRSGEAIVVCIDDDGPGIPARLREAVFKPFYRMEESRNPHTGGIGLGLTIARDVVRGHGGDISLDDSPQGGLRARVRLPV